MSLQISERRIQTVCLLVLTAIAVAAALFWLRAVMVPFVLALTGAYALAPLISLLTGKLHLPRSMAVVAAILIALLAFVLAGAIISGSVRQLAENRQEYQETIDAAIVRVTERLSLKDRFGVEPKTVDQILQDIPTGRIADMLVGTTKSVAGVVGQGLLVLIFMCFILLGQSGRTGPPRGTWGEAERRIKRFLAAKLLISGATGLAVGTFFWALGIDMAVAFGFFAFLLNFIPSIGSIIATLLPIPILLATKDISTAALVAGIAVPGVIQFSIGNVLEPKIMGESLELHPVVILMALIFWGILWGIVGMFLAVPITAVIRIILSRFELTVPVGDMLAGKLDALHDFDPDEAPA